MKKIIYFLFLFILGTIPALAASNNDGDTNTVNNLLFDFVLASGLFIFLILVLWLANLCSRLKKETMVIDSNIRELSDQISGFESSELERLINVQKNKRIKQENSRRRGGTGLKSMALFTGFILINKLAAAGDGTGTPTGNIMTSPGMLIMLTLILIPLLATVYFIGVKINGFVKKAHQIRIRREAQSLVKLVDEDKDFYDEVLKRKSALEYTLTDTELGGATAAEDKKALLHNIAEVNNPRFFSSKRKASGVHNIDPNLVKLIMLYLGTATCWLVIGTSIGEYLGIKFVSPDVDHVSWLSFGRLRPVHTNMVFWGWSSLAMIGLGYYVVGTVSNAKIASIKRGYWSLLLLNTAVISGTICLMSGINNGGGEYREYTWPVMLVFAAGIIATLVNYIQTIARRQTRDIYISNWYIIAAVMFLTVIVLVGYIPWWQNGLGETIVQGYYMHQAVGMWFMLFSLGLIYYFLPQQLNTPIYSYSLGILAFWSQILFYTLIGTHHFIFSSIPWWLQTIAIVGSMGMLIPVFSGTTNFLMTFKGNYHKIARSYTLPFYLVGIIFYFTGSTQGTAEAFRATNLIWHFTDFTVAHSHLTMYGIIAFMLWGCIYTLLPRLTGKEPKQSLVGAHFWLALIGMLFYTIPLMTGGTIKGMGWVAGKPFIDGVVLMAPYWLWRAIGGSLMWASHLVFAWNMYVMYASVTEIDERKKVFDQIISIRANTTV
nr:cbb3-type cytochrome c oxidase subunit I [Mucilaginibacter sp. L294]